jgi:tetratricopeptide (TPR) repeat protein
MLSTAVFVDKIRPAEAKLEQLEDMYGECDARELIGKVEALIKEDPYFLDSYAFLGELYDEFDDPRANQLCETAYKKALELIADKKGNWPAELSWEEDNNRHILGALLNKAMLDWSEGRNDDALKLMRKMLKADPQDEPGVRFFILAIRSDMTYDEFYEKFDDVEMFDEEVENWFERYSPHYPDEFEFLLTDEGDDDAEGDDED